MVVEGENLDLYKNVNFDVVLERSPAVVTTIAGVVSWWVTPEMAISTAAITALLTYQAALLGKRIGFEVGERRASRIFKTSRACVTATLAGYRRRAYINLSNFRDARRNLPKGHPRYQAMQELRYSPSTRTVMNYTWGGITGAVLSGVVAATVFTPVVSSTLSALTRPSATASNVINQPRATRPRGLTSITLPNQSLD